MFDVHFGEAFIVMFITVAVLSARYWPKLGEAIAVRLAGLRSRHSSGSSTDTTASGSTPNEGQRG